MALALLLLNNGRIQQRHAPLHRLIRDRSRPLDVYNDRELIKRYRFDRDGIFRLCGMCENKLTRYTRRGIDVPLQVLTALRFYGTGGTFTTVGDTHNVSRYTVSRCVLGVADILCDVAEEYINFPLDEDSLAALMQGFFQIAEFPRCIGALDGSLVPVKAPPGDEERVYVCRKNFHALNVSAITDFKKKFMNLIARWPGSANDSFIFRDSLLYAKFLRGEIPNGWLLGDSGYGGTAFLLTPLRDPQTRAERRYQRKHILTRNVVERTFGLWKNRFMCLHKWGGLMLLTPEKCCKVIIACAVLHNLAIDWKLPLIDDDGNILDEDLMVDVEADVTLADRQWLQQLEPTEEGDRTRNELIRSHFDY